MTTLRTAAQQALEALEKVGLRADARRGCDEAVGILRAALAEQDEPVATLITQRDALLEALKQSLEEAIYPSKQLSDVYEKARAAIKAVEETK